MTRPLLESLLSPSTSAQFPALAWTRDMRRLGVLVAHVWTFQVQYNTLHCTLQCTESVP